LETHSTSLPDTQGNSSCFIVHVDPINDSPCLSILSTILLLLWLVCRRGLRLRVLHPSILSTFFLCQCRSNRHSSSLTHGKLPSSSRLVDPIDVSSLSSQRQIRYLFPQRASKLKPVFTRVDPVDSCRPHDRFFLLLTCRPSDRSSSSFHRHAADPFFKPHVRLALKTSNRLSLQRSRGRTPNFVLRCSFCCRVG